MSRIESTEKIVNSIVESVDSYKKDHDRSTTLVEGICNILTKLSYYSIKRDDTSVSSFVSSDRLRREVEDEYFEQRDKLAKVRGQMSISFDKIVQNIETIRREGMEIDTLPSVDNLEQMSRSMIQQGMLEDTMICTLDSMMEHGDIDTDVFVTIIAAFKFSPYCNQGTLTTFLNSMR